MPAIRHAWVGVADISAALMLFEQRMALRREDEGPVSSDRMALWGLANASGHFVELSGGGYPVGRLRLVAFDPPAIELVRDDFGPHAPHRTVDIGPNAIDFYVPPPIEAAVATLVDAGLTPRTAPQHHQMGPSRSDELVFAGFPGLPILAMVGHGHKPTSQRPGSPEGPFSEIATISIIADTVHRSRAFYETGLGMTAVVDVEIPDEYRDIVCDLTGAPRGTPIHAISYAGPGEASGKLLLVHFLGLERARLTGRMRPGALGLNLFTMIVDDLSAALRRLVPAGAEVVAGPCTVDGDRIVIVTGPNEERFELVQHGTR